MTLRLSSGQASRPISSGIHDQIDIAGIDRYLTDLWDRMAGQGDEGLALARVRVLNLVVYGEHPSLPDLAERLADAVAVRHPSRLVAVYLDDALSGMEPNAAVSARCVLDRGGRREVCGEMIVLTVPGGARRWVPNLVTGLLLSDLPVALWWTGEPRPDDELFQALVREYAGLVLLDSSSGVDDALTMAAVADWAARPHHHAVVADLAWARLLPWRQTVAEFFDPPPLRPLLDDVRTVELSVQGEAQSAQALLFAGWLASRLRLELLRVAGDAAALRATYLVGGRRAELEITSTGAGGVPDRLLGVRLTAGERDTHVFEAHRGHDANVVHAHQTAPGGARTSRSAGRPEREDVTLVADLLGRQAPDPVYAAALAQAVALTRGGRREGPQRAHSAG